MQTAGLILDVYDDPRMLKSIYRSLDDIPEVVKTASILSHEELGRLPDTSFALVLCNGGHSLRKFACIDAGGTAVNIQYFIANRHKLPEEAQKVAAANLMVACEMYDLPVPEELQKVALSLNTAMPALMAPSLVKGTGAKIKDNMAGVHAMGGSQVVPIGAQAALGQLAKSAEASGTSLMPSQGPGVLEDATARGKPGSTNVSAAKSAAAHLVAGHTGEEGDVLAQAFGVTGTQYDRAPQAPTRVMQPHVDVSGAQPRTLNKQASAESYAQVQHALQRFGEELPALDYVTRRKVAMDLAERARPLGLSLHKEAQAYAATTFADDAVMQSALDARKLVLSKTAAAVLDTLYSMRDVLGPDGYIEALAELDKTAQVDFLYGKSIPDPVESTVGLAKSAASGSTWVHANDYVTREQLENYSVTAAISLRDDYGDDFVKEFQKDPWGVFQSLPLPQKVRLARRASDNSATGMHDVQV